jgi:hypothetical protein
MYIISLSEEFPFYPRFNFIASLEFSLIILAVAFWIISAYANLTLQNTQAIILVSVSAALLFLFILPSPIYLKNAIYKDKQTQRKQTKYPLLSKLFYAKLRLKLLRKKNKIDKDRAKKLLKKLKSNSATREDIKEANKNLKT